MSTCKYQFIKQNNNGYGEKFYSNIMRPKRSPTYLENGKFFIVIYGIN